MTFLTKPITSKSGIPLLIYFLFLSALELAAYKYGGACSLLASRLWLVTLLLCILLFLFTAIQTLITDIRNRNFLLLLGYFLLLTLFASKIGNLAYSDVSFEATLQVAAGLNSFAVPDLNYTGVAFLDYANRQYVINALPALLFGRNTFTLHLGFALPFLIGMTLLYLEIRAWLRQENQPEEFSLLPVYALPVFPFITEYFMNFEQTITPVALTMSGLALLMRFYRKQDVAGLLALSFVGGMCCNAYTPVLAFFGFLLVFLVLWGIQTCCHHKTALTKPGFRHTLWQVILCFTLVFKLFCYFTATLSTEQKSMITTAKQKLSLIKTVLTAWFDFFLDQSALFWGIWLLCILGYLFFSLLGMLKFHDFLVSGWMLLTVFFSTWLAGYTTYEKAHELQRNMLIIPVFVTAFFFAALRFFKKHPVRLPRMVLPAALVLLLLLGQLNFSREHHSFVYYRYVQPMKYMLAYTEELLAEEDIPDTEEFNLVLLTDNPLLSNLSDYTVFFYPNAHTYTFSPGGFPTEVANETDPSLPTFIFCETSLFSADPGGTLHAQTYNNERYHSTVTWYCLICSPENP